MNNLLSRLFHGSNGDEDSEARDPGGTRPWKPIPKTELSTTVFTGKAEEWVKYLAIPVEDRYRPDWRVEINWSAENRHLSFSGENEQSSLLAERLDRGMEELRAFLLEKPFALKVLDELIFDNEYNGLTRLFIRSSEQVPAKATREVVVGDDLQAQYTRIVLSNTSIERVFQDFRDHPSELSGEDYLGLIWPLLRRVISQLSYPSYPRDRYIDRINLTVKTVQLNMNVLYREKKYTRLIPSRPGELYEDYAVRRDGIPLEELHTRQPYFRMMNLLGFMLNGELIDERREIAEVVVRDYLDGRYLRLSIASSMPEISDTMLPMELTWANPVRPKLQSPKIGQYGILNREDLDSWRRIVKPFLTMGFAPLRQLGIGQYGRVYEAVNFANGSLPRRVAIKVDRFGAAHSRGTIEDAEKILDIGTKLSKCPHVIRVFDAGHYLRTGFTYHVIQLVDGDTLDNLVGITGTEHASFHKANVRAQKTQEELLGALNQSVEKNEGEAWRKERVALPFRGALTTPQALDILTSMMIWLAKVHEEDYAVHDLKNGNLMVSRRGQLKGIDLDSYAPIFSDMDRRTDYYFFSVSVLLFLLNFKECQPKSFKITGLLGSETKLREALSQCWPNPIEIISSGRVSGEDLTELMATIISKSRDGTYASDPVAFHLVIDQLIFLKRRLLPEEIILD